MLVHGQAREPYKMSMAWEPDRREKKKEIRPSPITKPPIPTEYSKTKRQHINATKLRS